MATRKEYDAGIIRYRGDFCSDINPLRPCIMLIFQTGLAGKDSVPT
jgi:hypothetical protein